MVRMLAAGNGTDGTLVRVNYSSFKQSPQNFVFIIDVSGSMASYIPAMREVMKQWLQTSNVAGCGLIIVVFSTESRVLFSARRMTESSRQDALTQVDSIREERTTNISAGIQTAATELLQLDSELPVNTVILTDGEANCGDTNVDSLAAMISAPQFGRVSAIMLTPESNSEFVKKLNLKNTASSPRFSGAYASTAEQLQSSFTTIFATFLNPTLLVSLGGQFQTIASNNLQEQVDLVFPLECGDKLTVSESGKTLCELLLSEAPIELSTAQIDAHIQIARNIKSIGSCGVRCKTSSTRRPCPIWHSVWPSRFKSL